MKASWAMLMGLGHALDIAVKLGYTESGRSKEAVESLGSCRRTSDPVIKSSSSEQTEQTQDDLNPCDSSDHK